ncbi:hypothetical protein [Desulfurococcus mucosus]|uniref:Alpha-glucosidase n=1 Tax=Desulfurococcus mucosus (strain ATCC 35584 / DSM 2162 / JCM 9187 / O7/1) TaxID=765177 RepID=E8R814_DESM0|nr:hypothetical protein [Desulfurococcus mucosus]ADV64640.1 alpha-glucosidase [Desulfurococcus mucosus DSM 2162]
MESTILLNDAADALRRMLASRRLSDPRLRRRLEEALASLESAGREITVDNVELARLINKKARDLASRVLEASGEGLPGDLVKELDTLVKWCKMAPYDFTDRIRLVRKGYRYYLTGMILFFILAGTFAQAYAVSALMLALPALMAMSMMKKRRSTGLMLAYASMPLPLVIFTWILGYAVYAFTNPAEASVLAGEYGLPAGLVYFILALYLAGSVIVC